MKHIINDYESATLQFSETIELELSDTMHGAIAIETTSTFRGDSSNEMRFERIRQHLNTSQVLKLIADLTQLLDEDLKQES